jgi:hypothetical protein
MPHAVMADLKIRSGSSPPEALSRGAAWPATVDVTFASSTGCGPGISGRWKAGLAIQLTVAETCYKSVKIGKAFSAAVGTISYPQGLSCLPRVDLREAQR